MRNKMKNCLRAFLCLALAAGFSLSAEAATVTGTVNTRTSLGIQGMEGPDGGAGVSIFSTGHSKRNRTARVQLIDKSMDMSELTHEEIVGWYQEEKAPAGRKIFLTETASDGTYEFSDVPAGEYYLVFLLPNDGEGYISSADYRNMKTYLPEWEHFEMSVVGFGTADAVRLLLREGQARAVVDYVYGNPFPIKVMD